MRVFLIPQNADGHSSLSLSVSVEIQEINYALLLCVLYGNFT